MHNVPRLDGYWLSSGLSCGHMLYIEICTYNTHKHATCIGILHLSRKLSRIWHALTIGRIQGRIARSRERLARITIAFYNSLNSYDISRYMYVRIVISSESHGEVMKQTDFKQLGSNSCEILDESIDYFFFSSCSFFYSLLTLSFYALNALDFLINVAISERKYYT